MNTKKYYFKSSNQINNIYGIAKIPNKIIGYVQIIHDKYDYISRYEEFLEFLANQGFVAYGIDLVGHGESISKENPLGDIRGENIPDVFFEDLDEITKKVMIDFPIKNEYINVNYKGNKLQVVKPLLHAVIGIGYGACVARYYTWKANNINALIIIGDIGFSLDFKKANKIYEKEKLSGNMYSKSEKLTEYVETVNNVDIKDQRIYRNSYRLSNLSDIRTLNKDEKCNYLYTNYGYMELLLLQNIMNLKQWISVYPKYLPILFLSGKEDPVTNYTQNIELILKHFKQSQIKNVFYKYYDNLRHDILFEKNNKKIYTDIVSYLLTILKSQNDSFEERKEYINAGKHL